MATKEKPAAASVLGRTLDEVIAAMSPESQARIAERSAQLHAEVEGLKALRKLAQRSQQQIAQSLGIKQPSVVKIEKQTDLYLSTLRRFVEAAGGTLELRVELPGTGPFTLTGVGEIG
ncbi:XRE family transcriptional regulator [Novosphingobium sp. Chol11]|uniref:XRE family transcriptional regulator n=1 Tax=Novosphingobium sp. Chol11 TaxID=1385763 RepID=UPI0025E3CDD1|nr:XRE family transcriptional regulator [Novosphingobium sp. Chol11]